MKIGKKALARAQRVLRTVILPRPYKAVLGTVLIDGGCATVTDLSHTVRVALGPAIPGEAPLLVPWSCFKALRGDTEIVPVGDPGAPRVRIGGASIATLNVGDFPAVPNGFGGRLEHVNLNRLLPFLRRADATRAHGDNGRELLTGIAVEADGAILSTDGFHASWSDPAACPDGAALAAVAGGQGVLPGVTYSVLAALGWPEAQVGFETVEGRPRWFFGDCGGGEALYLRGLEGRFFAVRELMPAEFGSAATLDREALIQTCDQAAKVAAEAPYDVALRIGGPTVRAWTKHAGNSFATDLYADDVAGDPITLGFNSQTLAAALRVVAAEQEWVRFEFSGVTTLARVSIAGGTYVAMPLQMPEGTEEPEAAEQAPPAAGEPAANREPEAVREVQAAEEPAPEPDPLPVAAEQPAPIEEPAESAPVAAPEPLVAEVPAEVPAEPAVPEAPEAEPAAPEAPEPTAPEADDGAEVVSEDEPDDLAALVLAAQAAVAAARRAVARLLAG